MTVVLAWRVAASPRHVSLRIAILAIARVLASVVLVSVVPGAAHADPAPTLLWEHYPGSSERDTGEAVAIDTLGNILIGGDTYGSIGRRDHQGLNLDAFVIKYSPEGEILWRRQPGPAGGEFLHGIATDLADNVVAVGSTTGGIAGANRGVIDGFVVTYAADGTVRWRRQFGTRYIDSANAVAIDPAGNIIVAGYVDKRLPCCETGDAVVIKYAPDGTEQWRRTFDLSGMDAATGVATDAAGDIFVVGSTASSAPGGEEDTFIARLSPDGTLRWIEQQAIPGAQNASSVALDGTGRLFVAGLQPGPMDNIQGFVAAFSGDGAELWRRGIGGEKLYDGAYGVAIDADGHVLISGSELSESIVASYSRAGALRWKIRPSRFARDGYALLAADARGHMAVVGTADVRAAAGYWNAHVARYETE